MIKKVLYAPDRILVTVPFSGESGPVVVRLPIPNADASGNQIPGGEIVLEAGIFTVIPIEVMSMTPSSGPVGTLVDIQLSGLPQSVRGLVWDGEVEQVAQITLNGQPMIKKVLYAHDRILVT